MTVGADMPEQDRRDMPIEIAMRQLIPRPIELKSHCRALQRDARSARLVYITSLGMLTKSRPLAEQSRRGTVVEEIIQRTRIGSAAAVHE
jgi:hypothetical protein